MAASGNDKALDAALASIEKQFGKGSVFQLGDDTALNVAAIPTGALSLDLALGIGGVPRGRVTEIYGPESSGKCLTADTHVWTDHGLETIEELFARVGQPASCTSRVTDVSDQGVRLVNEEGELELLGGVTHNNRRPAWRVTMDSGRHVDATANHPLRVLNERGRIVWRTVGELAEGDVMVSALFGAESATGGQHLSEDEAVLLGYLVAEGTLGATNRNAVTFTNAHDPADVGGAGQDAGGDVGVRRRSAQPDHDVLDEYVGLLERLFDVDPARVRTYADKDHKVHDTALRQRLADEYGLDFTGSAGKTVPLRVRTGGAKVQRAFLSALYEGDGWIEDGASVGLTSASRTLAEQVQLLLYGLGIPASLTSRHHDELDRDYHTVLVTPGAVDRFLDQVGFRSARRAEQVARHHRPSDAATATRHEHVPGARELLFDLRDAVGGDRELDAIIGDLRRSDLTSRPDGAIDCSPARLFAVLDWLETKHVPASAKPLVAQLHELAARPLTYERVTGVESIGEVPTFDVVVPDTHSFVANGVLSHNTTVALHIVAEAQKLGGIAAFIDAEHALDPVYARALGVDLDELLVSQPDTGEQALEIADMLVRSSAVDVIVIDSVAALTPRAEIEGEMGDTHVGLQARLMSQALRKLAGSLSKSKTSMIFINQLREKIGVMFGCASWDTRVTLADGSWEYIGKIVNQKLPVEVMSYDVETGEFAPKPVVDWYDNGVTDEFLKFTVDAPGERGGDGTRSFKLTPNHDVATPFGWVSAGNLSVGELVLRPVDFVLSEDQHQLVLGGLMGDGALSPSTKGDAANFRFGHGPAQQAYAQWKIDAFSNIPGASYDNDRGTFYDSAKLVELARLREAVYVGGRKVLSWDYLKQLTPFALAVWYQDDGTFQLRSKGLQERTRGGSGRSEICVEAMEATSRERLRDHLRDAFGVGPTLSTKGGNAFFVFDTATTRRFHELIADHVHPSMAYKLLPNLQDRARAVVVEQTAPVTRPVGVPIRTIETVPVEPGRRHRYDIQVEGNHSYLVNGTVVHNSPETTPGGRALKFYASVRLDVRRIESLKDGQDNVGNRVRVKVAKNKVAPPFRKAEFDIMYGEGISREGSLIDIGVDEGFIRKAGAWYTYDGEQLGQGRENARTYLKEHADIALEIEKRVLDKVGIAPLAAEEKAELDDEGDEDE